MRLDFLRDFVFSTGEGFNSVAEKLGISQSAIWRWFAPKNDDVKLSNIIKVAEVTGYSLHVSITKRKDILDNPGDPIRESSFRYVNGKLVSDPLSFLQMFMDRYEISKKELSERLNFPYTTLLYWFREGDVLVSKILEIGEAYDAVVCFNFEKNLPDETVRNLPKSDGPIVVVKTSTTKTY